MIEALDERIKRGTFRTWITHGQTKGKGIQGDGPAVEEGIERECMHAAWLHPEASQDIHGKSILHLERNAHAGIRWIAER